MRYIIGIDPGVNTGVCVWDMEEKRVCSIFSNKLYYAIETVMEWQTAGLAGVIFEDARLRKWFGSQARGSKSDINRLQGAGSVKRDCQILEEVFTAKGIKFIARSPQSKGVKMDAETFKRLSGRKSGGNEHSRDAFALVVGLTCWPTL